MDAIEARANAATAGPWQAVWDPPEKECDRDDGVFSPQGFLCSSTTDNQADMELMAHARTDIPRLVATVRHLQEQLAEAGPCGCPCYCPDGGGPFVKPDLADPLVMFFADRYGSGTSYQPIDPHVERPAEPPSGPEGEFI